jgi:hypothetical protein
MLLLAVVLLLCVVVLCLVPCVAVMQLHALV